MAPWSWRSSQGRSQAQQQAYLRDQKARNAKADKDAKAAQDKAQAKGRDIPQKGR